MALILVAGTEAGAGATTVAAGLAHRIAYAGHEVRVERLRDGSDDDRATADAEVFGSLEFAASSGVPVEATGPGDAAGNIILEAPTGADAAALATQLGAKLVFVTPAGSEAATAGAALVIETRARDARPGMLPEDRALAAPRVADLIAASKADVLSRSEEGDGAVCDYIVVGAISHDSADTYFERFPRSAVVTRSGRVDLALAAIAAGTECLILSGGGAPSPYILDRAAASRDTTLLVAPGDTPATVHAIEGTFGSAPFSGESKVERAGELMAAAVDDAALSALLS
jgi:BioD-like phosphotransacetylase family protein